jgi:hypothetical protein
MSGGKWIKRPGPSLFRTPILLKDPPDPPVHVFVDARALARWLSQGTEETEPRLPPIKRKAG